MKTKLSLVLILSALFVSVSFTQDLWEPAGIGGGRVNAIVKVTNDVFIAGFLGGGLYRSTDGGVNWQSISKKINNLGVFVLKVSSVGDIYAGTSRSIFKSTDQGLSWNKVHNSFPPNGYAEDITLDGSNNIYVAQNFGGVYKSTNGGNSWTQINSGLPSSKDIKRVGFTSNNILLAADQYRGIYKSTNFGADWVQSNTGFDSSYFVSSFSSNSAGVIFLSTFGNGPFKSTDNGNSWVSIKGDLTLNYCYEIDLNAGGDLFLAIAQQLYKSTNGGVNWTNITTMFNGLSFLGVYVDNNNNVWAGTVNSGIIKSTDGGTNWVNYTNGLTSTLIQSLVADASGNLFAAIPGKGLYSSTNNGQTWNKITVVNDVEDTFIRTVQTIPSGGLIVFNVYNGVYVSTNLTTWVPFNTGLTNQNIQRLAVSGNYYFTAGSDGKIFRTPRNTAGWVDITDSSASGYAYDLFISSAGELYYLFDEEVYKSTNNGDDWINVGNGVNGYSFSITQNSFGDIFVGTDQGVYRSTNAGANWIKDVSGLTDGALSLIAFGNNVFAGGYGSVSRSTDLGQTWTPFTTGIENCQISDIVFGSSNILFAAADNMGVHRTTSAVTSVDENANSVPMDFNLSQNYPNPFNPSTLIQYQVSSNSQVVLKVYDILGNEVATLVNEFKPAGNYEVEFYASTLTSGVYLYKLTAGEFFQTKKMMLLR